MKQKRISMPVRYGINLVLTIALWAVLFGLIRSGSITNYWSGILVTVGININKTISFTFAVGSALAGIGSVLYMCAYPQASPTMGSMLGLKAFVAAVLGGIGSIPGAVIGGFAIGMAEALVSAAGLSVWKDGVVFAILIVVLLVKPTGILGRPITEKV